MIFETPAKGDFDFNEIIKVDVQNEGFTREEMEKLAGPAQAIQGAMGIDDFLTRIWKKDRQVPPEIAQLKSEFGYQTRPVLTDLLQVAEIQKTQLAGEIIAHSSNYNFFVMRCGVFILPKMGENFEALKFEVYYEDDNVSTYAMLPGPQTRELLALGGKADIGITGKADFGFPQIALDSVSVDASAKAKLEANFIVAFHYELKTQLVDAFGAGNPFCKWMMYKGDNLRNDVIFYPVIMAPKSVTSFRCRFNAYFKINHPNWKTPEFFLKPPRTVTVSAS